MCNLRWLLEIYNTKQKYHNILNLKYHKARFNNYYLHHTIAANKANSSHRALQVVKLWTIPQSKENATLQKLKIAHKQKVNKLYYTDAVKLYIYKAWENNY